MGLEPLHQLLQIPGIENPQSRVRRLLSYLDVGCFQERAEYTPQILNSLAPYHEGARRAFESLPERVERKKRKK